ncbi:MAG TPA: Rieske 2Fe-2S domain-containing protein [Pseudonocardia sp.]|jgi:nitrite reductase/ring-hydroxylating ferredoxin subunit
MTASTRQTRLIALADLGPSGVTVVKQTPHGDLAVGVSDGRPFAVSNRCRHVFAPLGNGTVEASGELTCPWHAARFDVRTGTMTRGPQGVFKPVAGPIKATIGARKLKVYDVELRDGIIYLTD